MGIQINQIRICGFRGLNNIEVDLEKVTVLTGMNNTGKTTFLKALQIALGNRMFISQDDFFIGNKGISTQITIDLKFIPIDAKGEHVKTFEEDWEIVFTEERIRTDLEGYSCIPLRTIVNFDPIRNSFKTKHYILKEWPEFDDNGAQWHAVDNGTEKPFAIEEIPFFYVDAQRDIVEDIKFKTSYLGRMLSKIEYSDEDIERIEKQIKELNDETVASSDILASIKTNLKELDSAMDSSSNGVEVTPFTKKLRDLNKGLSIYYSDREDSFSMEYHGMGTRSWSSLLTLKSFIDVLSRKAAEKENSFFPIIAIEEPEAHLHPNAQKKLYRQMASMTGQSIISTHSTYIAGAAELSEIRGIYKGSEKVSIGKIPTHSYDEEELRKIRRQVINTRGDILFAKVLVFFEGETEEQALPIFAEKFFGVHMTEIGVDFIGVGGNGNYLAFLRLADSLGIPWFIFSDGEVDTVNKVQNAIEALRDCKIDVLKESNVFILENNMNFEQTLVNEGYLKEIKDSYEKLRGVGSYAKFVKAQHGQIKGQIDSGNKCGTCGVGIKNKVSCDYLTNPHEAFYDCMTSRKTGKTAFGPIVATEICNVSAALPKKVTELFIAVKDVVSPQATV